MNVLFYYIHRLAEGPSVANRKKMYKKFTKKKNLAFNRGPPIYSVQKKISAHSIAIWTVIGWQHIYMNALFFFNRDKDLDIMKQDIRYIYVPYSRPNGWIDRAEFLYKKIYYKYT